ncbi:hypothetical protein GJD64_29020, partial [Klebsiella pneumoniae]|nr:hypothetical protein [Klebsiella pneumoniae]
MFCRTATTGGQVCPPAVQVPAQVKQRLEEEKRRQQAWDAAHPEEGLKREYDKAKAELDAED